MTFAHTADAFALKGLDTAKDFETTACMLSELQSS